MPESRAPIMNAFKKFGGGALRWTGKAFVGLAPVFGVMTVQNVAKGLEEGLPGGEVAAQAIGEWSLPGMGEWHKDIQRNKMMKDMKQSRFGLDLFEIWSDFVDLFWW